MNNSDSAVTPVAATVTRPERVFPTLTAGQVARMAAHGRRRTTTRGEVLVEVGDARRDLEILCRLPDNLRDIERDLTGDTLAERGAANAPAGCEPG